MSQSVPDLHMLNLVVADMAASLAFYRRLGIAVPKSQDAAALNVVDDSQGPRAAERRYARLTGMREASLPDYPGSAVGWEDATIGPTAFVVELPSGRLSPAEVRRHVAALRALLRLRWPQTGLPLPLPATRRIT